MMLLLRALAVGLAIPVVLSASLAAQEPRVIPPNVPPLTMPADRRVEPPPGAEKFRARLRAQAKPTQQQEFTPISELPPEEQLAAAPLLVGAYAFVLAVLFGYLVMVSRRLSAIERDINRLAADLKPTGRS